MSHNRIEWIDDFVGLGYHVYDIRPSLYLIFDTRRKIASTWNRILKYWPDDEIKIRFIEDNSNYRFILHGDSRILTSKTIFLKTLAISEHYTKFKEEYDGSATLQLALYHKKQDKYELEIFKFKKLVTDVKFIKQDENDTDYIISRAMQKFQT